MDDKLKKRVRETFKAYVDAWNWALDKNYLWERYDERVISLGDKARAQKAADFWEREAREIREEFK